MATEAWAGATVLLDAVSGCCTWQSYALQQRPLTDPSKTAAETPASHWEGGPPLGDDLSSKALVARGFLNELGKPYAAKSVAGMLR